MCVHSLSFDTKKLVEATLIETDDHLLADEYDRNAHLAALLDHLLTLLHISGDVVLRIGHVVFLKVLLAHLAEVTGRGGVDGNGLVHGDFLVCGQYSTLLCTRY